MSDEKRMAFKPILYRPLEIPTTGHPAVRRLFELMVQQQAMIKTVAQRAGVSSTAMKGWKRKACGGQRTTASIDNIEACLNVLGYTLAVVPKKDD